MDRPLRSKSKPVVGDRIVHGFRGLDGCSSDAAVARDARDMDVSASRGGSHDNCMLWLVSGLLLPRDMNMMSVTRHVEG